MLMFYIDTNNSMLPTLQRRCQCILIFILIFAILAVCLLVPNRKYNWVSGNVIFFAVIWLKAQYYTNLNVDLMMSLLKKKYLNYPTTIRLVEGKNIGTKLQEII